MTTFEERYTAWIDGQLEGPALRAFEKELEAHPEAEADRAQVHRLGELLRSHAAAPALGGGEFFNTQLLERIASGERATPAPKPGRAWFEWAMPHLAWGAVCSLLVSLVIYREAVAPTLHGGSQPAEAGFVQSAATPLGGNLVPAKYDAGVMKAQSMDPDVYATPVQSKKEGANVLWLDGLDYLPANYSL